MGNNMNAKEWEEKLEKETGMKIEDMFENYENPNYYTSISGEFFVLAELSRREYMASLTYGNAKSVDILVSTKDGNMFRIEVKTSRSGKSGSDKSQFGENYKWQMSKKDERKIDPKLYYCFVSLRGEKERPKFFIVPSKEVAEYVKWQSNYWFGLKRKKPVDKETKMRAFRIGTKPNSKGLKPIKKYEDAWHILPK